MNTIQTGVAIPQVPDFGVGRSDQRSGAAFGETLGKAIHQVDELQVNADQQVSGMLRGESSDLHNAMIAVEKADLSFQLMMQVRNKIVAAYQEVSRMQF